MRELPTGTVTLFFTDIEGSTRLLHELGDRYAIAVRLRDRPGRIFGVGIRARVAAERGQSQRAGRLWAAVEDEDAVAPLGGWRRHRDQFDSRIRRVAGPEFDRGYAEGRDLTLDDAVSLALSESV